MKKLLAIAFCTLFAAFSADAKTYYVNAKRPNNNGNGLKPKTAKKTIQAAINIAKKGDTILVYPGTYSPIRTNNKKITVKSVKGKTQTTIVKPAKQRPLALAQLGKVILYIPDDDAGYYSESFFGWEATPRTEGKATTLTGFLLDGLNQPNGYSSGYSYEVIGISGGMAKSCTIQRLGGDSKRNRVWATTDSTLMACVIRDNCGLIADEAVLNRCRIERNEADNDLARWWYTGNVYYWLENTPKALIDDSCLFNCLVIGNKYEREFRDAALFASSTIVNCTITANEMHGGTNTCLAKGSKFRNCILRDNQLWGEYWGDDYYYEGWQLHNVDPGNSYGRTYKDNCDSKFLHKEKNNYKLAKDSPCIDQGTLSKSLAKRVGAKDLAGSKRVRGKAVDMGCYEY